MRHRYGQSFFSRPPPSKGVPCFSAASDPRPVPEAVFLYLPLYRLTHRTGIQPICISHLPPVHRPPSAVTSLLHVKPTKERLFQFRFFQLLPVLRFQCLHLPLNPLICYTSIASVIHSGGHSQFSAVLSACSLNFSLQEISEDAFKSCAWFASG